MEKDHAKYLLYMAAIAAAVGSMAGSRTECKCLVVGPGRCRPLWSVDGALSIRTNA